jgi:hypothetical protein
LDVDEETVDDGSLMQGLGDVMLSGIVHVEYRTPCAPTSNEENLSSESQIEIDTSQSISVHDFDENLENDKVAQTSLHLVQSGQEFIEEPVQSVQSVPKAACARGYSGIY